jgi:hypothetical protein
MVTVASAQGPPGGGFGGPPGGGFDPSDFLKRMDTNGNGTLEPDEMQGRARFFLERMAQSVPGMSLDRPIPLNRLTEAFERMRQERFGGGSSRGGSDRGDSDRGDRGSSSSSSSSSSQQSEDLLVPGFGVELALDPVPGFGQGAAQFAVRIEESDYREADQTLARNDSNKDGVLDKEEISRGRWRDDPTLQDRNRDGKLSRTELALRYAMRRIDREGGSSKSSSGSSSGSRSSSSSSSSSRSSGSTSSRSGSSSSTDPRLEGLLRSVFERYDRNRNGEFEKDEWSSFRTNPAEADKNRDGKISRSEISNWLQEKYLGGGGDSGRGGSDRGRGGGDSGDSRRSWFGGGGGGFGGPGGGGFSGGGFGGRDRGDGSSDGGSGSSDQAAGSSLKIVGKSRRDQVAYDIPSAVERIPDEIPAWFKSLDVNADGQLAMAEFKATWSASDVADFAQFDLNSDGIIHYAECLAATERGAVRGAPSPSTTATADSTGGSDDAASGTSQSSASSGSSSDSGSSTDRYVRYAVGFIRKYDDNGDGVLVKEEWSKMSRDYSGADEDKDGKITPAELAKAMTQR